MRMENTGFVGVHVGAGKYSSTSTPAYEKLCRIACRKGVEILNTGGSALNAVTVATAILEDSPLTNAGYGSNLTMDGNVECDASVMNGVDMSFGAVGSVSGVKNPVMLAKKICAHQNEHLELGRIPPCVLVGPGAYDFAVNSSDIITVHPESQITRYALKSYHKYRAQLQNVKKIENDLVQNFSRLDTVGAVCIDKQGHTAAACSSGGILLKQSGRVGQAAMYGCGCWAEDTSERDNASVAVTTSGCGEYIMKCILAREVAHEMKKPISIPCVSLNESINKLFLNSRLLKNIQEKLCGMLVLRYKDNEGEFLWAHTTPAMCIGYMNTSSAKAKSRISKLPSSAYAGKSVVVEGVSVPEMNL